ncbi:DEAD/DEAH box helicase [Sphingobacterium spiritivorum]|uniref:Helicase conserved C-terminal domain-containing protein n=2 Tax=Bacteroidota TaxID=976 RepID=A0A1H6KHX7_9FLAO|nr:MULTISPECIES: DEAD/DEAH box helicase [Bacteroidota]SEH71489.1 Helicase conserved C-terminal domain-containing protein [Paenimyroides aquimaris]
MEIFESCHIINDLLNSNQEVQARNELIKLLDYHERNNVEYSPLVNHLIRHTGLYPYLKAETANWEDRFVYEIFKVDTGGKQSTLHREQSSLLKRLVNGENIAVSAPTSFGKSFVIDAFISIKDPDNVVIIVPTIALTDETRRRLYKKFAHKYKIITTTEVELAERNIFIFPQERAMNYINKIDSIDILIIDEFYKASSDYDKSRSPSLLKAIIKLGHKSKQKYFLAPNITSIGDNVFTQDMEFEDKLGFNTVYLDIFEKYKEIAGDKIEKELQKGEILLNILEETKTKSLIYAASYPQIDKVSNLLNERLPISEKPLLIDFANWLTTNYGANWKLTNLVKRGVGIHNGQLHRSISQIQVKLFEEQDGLNNIISTSSIIEGVNTSAENVVIWRNRKSGSNSILDSFTYKNIIGRSGRMFKYFIGKIYLLEAPPQDNATQLDIPFPDTILGDLDEDIYSSSLNNEQISKIITFKGEMYEILGKETYDRLLKENIFQSNNSDFIKETARQMKANPEDWNGLSYLNSDDPESWDRLLWKIISLQPGEWGDGAYGLQHKKFVEFVKVLVENWGSTIPELLDELDEFDIDIEQFFKLERIAAFNLSSLISDINILQREILDNGTDVSPFVSKVSHAFLPSVVYQLEEYGLPRMISRKLYQNQIINFMDDHLNIHNVIDKFHEIGKENIKSFDFIDSFEKYIIEYFYDGITVG